MKSRERRKASRFPSLQWAQLRQHFLGHDLKVMQVWAWENDDVISLPGIPSGGEESWLPKLGAGVSVGNANFPGIPSGGEGVVYK